MRAGHCAAEAGERLVERLGQAVVQGGVGVVFGGKGRLDGVGEFLGGFPAPVFSVFLRRSHAAHDGQRLQRLAGLQRCAAAKIADPTRDRVAPAGRDVLPQIGRAILVGPVVAPMSGQRGLFEIVADRAERAENRSVSGNPPQVFIPTTRLARPMGKHHRGRVVEIHGVAQFLGDAQERFRPAGVDGQAAEGLDGRAVDALPLNAALVAGGKPAVVERAMQRGRETMALEDLRQHGRQSESSPAEDRGTPLEVFLIGRQSAAKLQLDGLDFQQRQSAFAVLPADQRRPLVGQRLLEHVERGRLAPGHLFDDLGRNEQISRQPAAQLRLQRGPQRARRDQRQVEQPGFGGIEILAGFVEPIEGRLEMAARGLRHCPGGLRRLPPAPRFAAIASSRLLM